MKTTVMTIATLFAFLSPDVSAADCPENSIFSGPEGVILFSTSAGYGYHEGPEWSYGQPCAGACYDLRQGYLFGSSDRGPWISPQISQLRVADVFHVEGLPLGTAVSFHAELQIEVLSKHPARLIASIRATEAGTEQSIDTTTSEATETQVLSIPIRTFVGDPFALECSMFVGPPVVDGYSVATGRIRFRDLPPGGFIASCQSYDVPVPSRGVTWGEVKVLYRD